ncbi:alpha/beta fold hydrolase [Leptospira adleri]|uniref:Alpha/beta hydrolase n=1 Tax=Leptospira adleri TaxID=2023186 RepID=A0A2M9YU55_9LEPT|nr:alpha/beta fold hydrolase [Leptospira adleri]PJZ55059.1 alpha/beta hydrolase [Leptospira adleri]PJZ63761.1 alpha/beta hydrolase [Leptospira adleri]
MSGVDLNFRKVAFRNEKYREPICGPILVLHGLFGSSKNWATVGDFLSGYSDVYLLDLRNHGDSPHVMEHSLASMVEDVEVWVRKNKIVDPVFLGHSMGGLVSMGFALRNPEIPSLLLIQDIVPKDYPLRYDLEFACLRTDVSNFKTRQEIDAALSKILPNAFIRNFLEMNLERMESGGYRWKLNVEGIEKSPRLLRDFFSKYSESPYLKKTNFLIGGASEYFLEEDIPAAQKFFPNSKFYRVPDGDHYIHFTKASEYKRILESIFEEKDDSEFLIK